MNKEIIFGLMLIALVVASGCVSPEGVSTLYGAFCKSYNGIYVENSNPVICMLPNGVQCEVEYKDKKTLGFKPNQTNCP